MLRKNKNRDREIEYNAFIAMIDVVFLLLLYFIMTFKAVTDESLLDFSPAAGDKSAASKKVSADLVMLEITEAGTCLLNSREIPVSDLSGWLNEIASCNPDTGLVLLCREHVKHAILVEVLDLCRKSKLHKISLAAK